MKVIFYRILIIFIVTIIPSCGTAKHSSDFKKWMDLSSEKLIEQGDRFLQTDNNVDSALVCFTIVGNRFNKNMSDSEKLLCCKAEYNKWYIYFAKIFDYTKAYECLLNTDEILEESGLDFPNLNLGYAVFFHTLAGHSYDTVLDRKAYKYCMEGFWAAYEQKDYKLLDVFFCNTMLVAETLDEMKSLKKEWNVYKNIKREGVFNFDFNILQYEARILKREGKYSEAHKYADKLIDLSLKNGSDLRRIDIAYLLKARIYYSEKDFNNAIKVISKDEKLMMENNLRDCRLELYYFMTKCYNELGDTSNSNKFGNKYYLLKDSIVNLKQMTNVGKMSFINKIKKMDNELNKIKYKRSSQIIFVILSSVFSFILLIFVALLFYKNRQLKDKNRKLYERNIEMMNSEDIEIKSLKNLNNDTEEEIFDETEVTDDESEANAEGEKYKNSSLSVEDKKELLAKILNVMEDVDEICSISFSAERLAQLTDSKYKYVSQVINEKYGCNFNMFLNKFRIKEACRRFSDVNTYGQYTIDAMSQSLGFKSRTTFTSSFKKIIGITPSQYSKLAKEDKDKAVMG